MLFPRLRLSPAALALCAVLPFLPRQRRHPAPNPIIEWNRTLLSLVRTPSLQPATIHSTRNFAMMHVAMEDAVRSFNGSDNNGEALRKVAAIAAAHEVLISLYPSVKANLDQTYQASLATLATVLKWPGSSKPSSLATEPATGLSRERANDGSNATPPTYTFGMNPGDYQSTPPNFPSSLNWCTGPMLRRSLCREQRNSGPDLRRR